MGIVVRRFSDFGISGLFPFGVGFLGLMVGDLILVCVSCDELIGFWFCDLLFTRFLGLCLCEVLRLSGFWLILMSVLDCGVWDCKFCFDFWFSVA